MLLRFFSFKNLFSVLGMLSVLVLLSASPAAASKSKIGVLTCISGPKIGLVLGSTVKLKCSFVNYRNETENYTGRMSRIGLDIGITAGTAIIWAVLAVQQNYTPGSLAGTYVGVSLEQTTVIGTGVNVLVGGSKKSITLQPFSGQGQVGLSIAAGIAKFSLRRSR
ncbi:MAG: DUF992 domain-containing protein [Hyphomicrobiales bacterium]|nr:DUF992 domain-containing protein [Hyphomicrobiales bacterium]